METGSTRISCGIHPLKSRSGCANNAVSRYRWTDYQSGHIQIPGRSSSAKASLSQRPCDLFLHARDAVNQARSVVGWNRGRRSGDYVTENLGRNSRQPGDKLRVDASPPTLRRVLFRWGFTVKTVIPAEKMRRDVVEARKTYHRDVARKKPGRLVVLDETAFTTNMYITSGNAPRASGACHHA